MKESSLSSPSHDQPGAPKQQTAPPRKFEAAGAVVFLLSPPSSAVQATAADEKRSVATCVDERYQRTQILELLAIVRRQAEVKFIIDHLEERDRIN